MRAYHVNSGDKQESNTRSGGITFQVEHVEEAEPPVDAIWPPVTEDDDRVLTADAVPMTAYYRGNESSHGRVRPSLVELHEGRYGKLDSVTEEVCVCIYIVMIVHVTSCGMKSLE